jgi:hypothetical protein
MISYHVSLFVFLIQCDYITVARQIRYWNIAMVTPGAMARDFATKKKSMFNLTTRVGSNINSIVN